MYLNFRKKKQTDYLNLTRTPTSNTWTKLVSRLFSYGIGFPSYFLFTIEHLRGKNEMNTVNYFASVHWLSRLMSRLMIYLALFVSNRHCICRCVICCGQVNNNTECILIEINMLFLRFSTTYLSYYT